MTVKIISTGSYMGSNIVNNEELYAQIAQFDPRRAKETLQKKGTNVDGLSDAAVFDAWVRQVCGVAERSFFNESDLTPEGPTYACEYMGFKAGQNAIEDAGVRPEEIDLVIFCSFTPDQVLPNPGCTIAHFLGTSGGAAYHVNTACSGFLDGLGLARAHILAGDYERVLVVASENMSAHIDFKDVTTAILFGDGAAAALLEKSDDDSGILSFDSKTSYNREMLNMDSGSPLMMEGGPLVQRNAVNAMHSSLNLALEKANLSMESVNYLLPHQANLRIILRLADKCKIPHENTLQSVVNTGNTSAAAIGIGLDRAFRGEISSMQFQKGDILGLTVVGGGYTFSGMVYRW